ncbi:xylitol dehydrogenase [Orobanche gracilis]
MIDILRSCLAYIKTFGCLYPNNPSADQLGSTNSPAADKVTCADQPGSPNSAEPTAADEGPTSDQTGHSPIVKKTVADPTSTADHLVQADTHSDHRSNSTGGIIIDEETPKWLKDHPIQQIIGRLTDGFKTRKLASACYMERIDHSTYGFYITPDIGFHWVVGRGTPFRYFTYGAALAEVEIDTSVVDFHTRQAGVILDLGLPLNPAIDVGQGAPNPKAIHSSKAVGEPPFFLASAVFFAIKDAIIAARAEVGLSDWFCLENPATPGRIHMDCVYEFTKPFIDSDSHPKLSV